MIKKKFSNFKFGDHWRQLFEPRKIVFSNSKPPPSISHNVKKAVHNIISILLFSGDIGYGGFVSKESTGNMLIASKG